VITGNSIENNWQPPLEKRMADADRPDGSAAAESELMGIQESVT
jgi:hypothetical protein